MIRQKVTYIIGHRNPDTDSVVSAMAYAVFKSRTEEGVFIPARAGKLNPQTEYILNRLGLTPPEFISDLIPKVDFFMTSPADTLADDTSLWEALQELEKTGHKMLPVVGSDGTYKGALHYNAFARNMMQYISPGRATRVPTSLRYLAEALQAKVVLEKERDVIFKSRMLVAAMEKEAFRTYLDKEKPEEAVVIVGNRRDIQALSIERGVRVLIITGGKALDADLAEEARKKKVSVLVSPYGTARTSWLAMYSSPVESAADFSLEPVKMRDPIRKIKERLNRSVSRCLPVTDEENRLIGVLSQGDILREPHIELILVDHNESGQAVEGVEHYRIREIIDHHRLGNMHTDDPITFINRPVGATATLIASLFFREGVSPDEKTAALLLAGILSDTVILQSATTTDEDRTAAASLAEICGLSVEAFGQEIMKASSRLEGRSCDEILDADLKYYQAGEIRFSVSQAEVISTPNLLRRKEEMQKRLEERCRRDGLL
ncbi:MAG TPA: putative manganese-dependent inorganic diphosphatase, partial [Candidatus Mcinerneyibacteriales bacterium]|nr:putative manganese-dependent inorganic diphosphatase [Candidatus Mcinerneyibacteriales bacterium]